MFKKLSIVVLSVILCFPMQIYGEENETIQHIEQTIEFEIHSTYVDYLEAIQDAHFFDEKENDDEIYNALKNKIIEINNLTETLDFTIDCDYQSDEMIDLEETFDQIIEDMECYLYWSNGKVDVEYDVFETMSLYTIQSISFEFFLEDIEVNEQGIFRDSNQNILVPWHLIEEQNITLQQLKEMCGDSLILIMDTDNEHVLFVGGKFSNQKAWNEEDALISIQKMKDLIGLKDNEIFVCTLVNQDGNQNTYYRFTQKQGDILDINRQIVIGCDTQGNVLCLSAPSLNDGQDYSMFSNKDALNTLKKYAFYYNWTYVQDSFQIEFYEPLQRYCYTGIFQTADGLFAKIFLTTNYEDYQIVAEYYDCLEDLNNPDVHPYDYYFKGDIPTTTMTFTGAYGEKYELPVAYKEGKGYYIIDLDRKIIATLANTMETNTVQLLEPYYFDDPEDVSAYYVNGFVNIQHSMTTYHSKGIYDYQTPTLITFLPENTQLNAYALTGCGFINICLLNNSIVTTYDIISHELTHCFTDILSGNIAYKNATGAIYESLADICGNTLEMIAYHQGIFADFYKVDLETWKIGESSNPIRSMANPSNYAQPDSVYSKNFYIMTKLIHAWNDYGGVHTNSGILNNIAYRMYKEANLSLEEILVLFFNTQNLLNNSSTYDTIKGYVLYQMQQYGYDTNKIKEVEKIFNDANVERYNPNDSWNDVTTNEDEAVLKLTISNETAKPVSCSLIMYDDHIQEFSKDSMNTYGQIEEKGYVVTDLIPYFIKDYQNTAFGQAHLNEKVILEDDTQISADYYDLVCATLTQNDVDTEITNVLAAELIKVLFKVPDAMSSYVLNINNKNEDNDYVGINYDAYYNDALQGFHVAMQKDTTYDLTLSNEEDKIEITDFEVETQLYQNEYEYELNEEQTEFVDITPPLEEIPETVG